MHERELLERLRKIEALIAQPDGRGDSAAEAEARRCLRERLAELQKGAPPPEHRFTLADTWSQRLFLALLRHFGLRPYRHRGQRYTTVMVRAPNAFVEGTLWPRYLEMHRTLHGFLEEVANDVTYELFRQKPAEAEEAPAELPGPGLQEEQGAAP